MNIIVLHAYELGQEIKSCDQRYKHIQRILKKKKGDWVRAGVLPQEGQTEAFLGKAHIAKLDSSGLVLDFLPSVKAPPLLPITLILGLPRPGQTGRILKDLTCLGISTVIITNTDLSESSYSQSGLLKNPRLESHLCEGACIGGNPRVPAIAFCNNLSTALSNALSTHTGTHPTLPQEGNLYYLHLQDASSPPIDTGNGSNGITCMQGNFRYPLVLAVGPERGWSAKELALFKEHYFQILGLGKNILRTEAATLLACGIAALQFESKML